MANHMKFLARCPPATTDSSAIGKTTGRLPAELLSEQVQRLALFSGVIGALWTYGLLTDLVLVPLLLPGLAAHEVHGAGVPIELFAIVLSVVMVLYLRFAPHTPETKTSVGLGYMIANAADIAILNNWIVPPELSAPGIRLSWITNLILVFSIIAPTTPRRMLRASLAAASMDPLMAWLAHIDGRPTLSVAQTLLLYMPNYTAALVATIPGKILHHISRRLREAQEMGSYQLIELLGQGGMGEVWRARHRLLARNAAIKIVRPEKLGVAGDADGKIILRRFEREAQATASLSSPHTIRVFDYGMTDEGTFYYVMELLQGRDLESLVKEFGPVPASRAVFLLRQVCHSLADAHARGLVHRDIKPANIFTCRMGLEYDFVKVLDFGLVKFNGRGLGQTLMTVEHTTTGTPAYMAPEIILGESNVDRRADVYAVGCVAYYLLTGELVFEAETPMKMMLAHVQSQPVPPSQRTELPISRELDDLVMACLQKDPNNRPQNAEELFQLAERQACEGWNHSIARSWWERHLPDMTGPLVIGDAESDTATLAGVTR
jgi:tRNA A-37 threonylcarbamoyl transferase component Bud32